jgi:hypothetical protein
LWYHYSTLYLPILTTALLVGEENEIFLAHLVDIDSETHNLNAILISAESETHEDNTVFVDPRIAILVLLIKTAREVERKISSESSNDGDIDVDDTE